MNLLGVKIETELQPTREERITVLNQIICNGLDFMQIQFDSLLDQITSEYFRNLYALNTAMLLYNTKTIVV